jgi:apolipoprotein N-acyltransferase
LFRAIEYRRPWLRVSNSGISIATDARGVIIEPSQLPVAKQASAAVTLYSHDNISVYQTFGRYLTVLLAVLLIIIIASPRRSRSVAS